MKKKDINGLLKKCDKNVRDACDTFEKNAKTNNDVDWTMLGTILEFKTLHVVINDREKHIFIESTFTGSEYSMVLMLKKITKPQQMEWKIVGIEYQSLN